MNYQKKVSILIPVYNREKIINETIESALNQTYENCEIIIVDNCSTDKTYEVCNEYEKKNKNIKLYQNKENLGPFKNWVECAKKATGEYIKIIWSDDWVDSNFIEKTLPYLEDKEIAFAYSAAYLVSKDSKKLVYNLFKKDKVCNINDLKENFIFSQNTTVSPGCAIFRREDVLNNLMLEIPNGDGLIFSKYGAGNDLLLFLLTLRHYKKIAYVDSTKAYFRAHDGSLTCSNKLGIYYDWARLYYLNLEKDQALLNKFKTIVWRKKLKDKEYRNIYKSIEGKISYAYLLKKGMKKIKRKIIN